MMNYIKSEIYRAFHDKSLYCFVGVLTGLAFLLNAVIGAFHKMEGASFPYATTSFSYSNLVANPMVFCAMGAIIGSILYEGNRRNGNLKNTISFGISRTKVFAGECVTATIMAAASLIVVLVVYIAGAVLFLEHTGVVSMYDLLTEVLAVFLLAVAALILGILCVEAFTKSSMGMVVWFVIWFILPKAFFYLGLRIEAVYKIAMWMPANFFGSTGMIVNQSQCITAWGTAEGMTRCIISGIAGILAFSVIGVVVLRKRDL